MKQISFLSLMMMSSLAFAKEPTLTLVSGNERFVQSRMQLLKSSEVEDVQVQDANYKGELRKYKAIQVFKLLKGFTVDRDSTVVFRSVDGYSKVFSQAELKREEGVPYLAIETPKEKWPKAMTHPVSPAPFYLVWVGTQKVSEADWPYQISTIEVKPSLKVQFPKIFPREDVKPSDVVMRGFEAFQKRCFHCHTINGQGSAAVGPDLNLPMGPTEYFQEKALKRYIREPRSVRVWAESKMPATPPDVLSDSDLDALVAYLAYMTQHK